MKRIKQIVIPSAALMLLLGVSGAPAQSKSQTPVQKRQGVVDANGDGICDITGRVIGNGAGVVKGRQNAKGKQNGPGNGTGNQGNGPKDGTGYGAQSGKRLGPQDGSKARIGQGSRLGNGGPIMGARGRRGGRK